MPPTDDVIKKIQLRGHWRVVIRPTEFDAQRVPDIAQLFDLVRQTSVELRGWDFPHVDLQEAPRIGHDYVEQTLDWSGFVEVWRLYQSGQFYFLGAMHEDWSEEHWAGAGQRTASGARLPTTSTVFQYTEFFEFAARLALTAAGAPRMSVAIEARKLNGRKLWNDNQRRVPFHTDRVCQVDAFMRSNEFERDELVANPKGYAVREVAELFKRFTWSPGEDFIADMQAELYRRP